MLCLSHFVHWRGLEGYFQVFLSSVSVCAPKLCVMKLLKIGLLDYLGVLCSPRKNICGKGNMLREVSSLLDQCQGVFWA